MAFTTIRGKEISSKKAECGPYAWINAAPLSYDFETRSNFGEFRSLARAGFHRAFSSKVSYCLDGQGRMTDSTQDTPCRYEFPSQPIEDFISGEWIRAYSALSAGKGNPSDRRCTIKFDEFQKTGGGAEAVFVAKYSFSWHDEGKITLEGEGMTDTGHYLRGDLTNNIYVGALAISLSPNTNEIARKVADELKKCGVLNVALVLYG